MSTTNPIGGNQYFTGIGNTIVSPNAIRDANEQGGLAQLYQVEGTLIPTAAGVYAFSGPENQPIQIPNNAVVLSGVLSADVALAGGTFLEVFLTSAATGFTGPIIGSQTQGSLANINLGVLFTGPTGPFLGSANPYVAALASGTFTAGKARVRLAYVDTHPGN